MSPLKIDVFTFVHNEEQLMPFFLRHYEQYARRIIVYDDDSMDATCQVAASHPLVEIRDGSLGGSLDEDKMLYNKNNCYKGSDADYVVVCDVDEFLFHQDLLSELVKCKEQGITLPNIQGFEMLGRDGLPSSGQLYDTMRLGIPSLQASKNVVFDPEIDIRYFHGAHACDPVGNVVRGGSFKLLHYNFVGADYIVDRWASRAPRVRPDAAKRNLKTFDWEEQRLREYHAYLLKDATEVI